MFVIDQIQRRIDIDFPPKRVVSLVPSITFLLYRLGLEQEVVGLTRFCKLPKYWKKQKQVIGGTKEVNIDKIISLKPDLILANKEENTKEIVDDLSKIAPVYVSDIYDLETNTEFILQLGKLLDKEQQAHKLVANIAQKFSNMQALLPSHTYKTLYLIWKNPYMTVGGETFIHQMMQYAGFENIYANYKRYPVIQDEEFIKLQPEIVLLSSEPYPFKLKNQKEIQTIFPRAKVLLVEGEPFTWFGAYPELSMDYFINLQKTL